MEPNSSNKTIAKNTTFLYVRMLFTMLVTLYTSRVVLDKLGVDDFGIYQAVGGIVGLLTFINGALSTGASRFITYALGEDNFNRLRLTFSTTLVIHISIALVLVFIAETFGLWFVYNKLVVPPERMEAAVFAYHISVISSIFPLIQVSYNATVIAHERMSMYAYTGIFGVCAKLAICYLLSIGQFDRLKLYSLLLLIIQVALLIIYVVYCTNCFKECKFSLKYESKIAKEILSFSGWSLFAHGSLALNGQGVLILLNMFFSPAIVSARAVSTQVYMAATQFVNNFRTAVNPQIVKRLAAGDTEGSHRLLLRSTCYSYFLMLMLCLPLYLLAEPILHIWLKEVPEYTTVFMQIILIQSLFQVFDTSFYTALYAMGRLKENALLSPTIGFIQFPIIYYLFKIGCSPIVLSWTNLLSVIVLAAIIKPILLTHVAKYTRSDIWFVYRSSIIVTLVSLPLPVTITYLLGSGTLLSSLVIVVASILSVTLAVWFFGIEKDIKELTISFLRKHFTKKKMY